MKMLSISIVCLGNIFNIFSKEKYDNNIYFSILLLSCTFGLSWSKDDNNIVVQIFAESSEDKPALRSC